MASIPQPIAPRTVPLAELSIRLDGVRVLAADEAMEGPRHLQATGRFQAAQSD